MATSMEREIEREIENRIPQNVCMLCASKTSIPQLELETGNLFCQNSNYCVQIGFEYGIKALSDS